MSRMGAEMSIEAMKAMPHKQLTVPAQGGLLPTMQEGKDFTITHPQQKREWVGLTEEERQHFRGLGFVGVEQVEAKLREKNGC